jgi:hypothetical protein
VNDIIAGLEKGRDILKPYFSAPKEQLGRTYAPGKWSMRYLLLHLVDSETVYFDRIRRAAGDDKPLLIGFDENHWSQRLFYDQRSLELARELFVVTRDSVIEFVRLAPASLLAREGVHNEIGKRSVEQLLRMTSNHVLHHAEQCHAIAAGKTWAKKA